MASCKVFESLISASMSQDRPGAEGMALERHLETCDSCRSAREELFEVISIARSEFVVDDGLPAGVRATIARTAAERVSRRGFWRMPLGLSVGFQPRAAVLVAATAVVVALLALPIALRRESTTGSDREVAVKIDVAAERDGAVRIAWSDGTKASYTVYRSTDPRHPDAGEPHKVNGNVWIDRAAGSAQVVYYRIE